MLRFAQQQIQSVGNQLDDRLQRFDRARRTARQIQNQRLAAHAAYAAAQGGVGSLLDSFGAHAFGYAFDELVANGDGGIGRHIAWSDSSSSGRDDQAYLLLQGDQQILNFDGVVGNALTLYNVKSGFLQQLGEGRAGI